MPKKIYIFQHKKYKDIYSIVEKLDNLIKHYGTKEFTEKYDYFEVELGEAKKFEIVLENSIKYK